MDSEFREKNSDEPPEAPTEARFPEEIRDLVWKSSFTPQNIVVQQCFWSPFGDDHSIPDSSVYFNFDIDTLMIHPYRYRLDRGYSDTEELFYSFERVTSETRAILRSCFGSDDNHLQRIQSLVLGEHIRQRDLNVVGDDVEEAEDYLFEKRKWLQVIIKEGLRNLRKLVVVFRRPNPENSPSPDDVNPEIAENCRQDLISVFEDVKSEYPDCKIPEVTVFEHNDPRAPKFY